MDFSTITGVIMDMDGVLWRGKEPLPGAAAFCDFLRKRGLPFALASNNSSRTPEAYEDKLDSLQIGRVDQSRIVTSGTATADYLKAHYPAGSAVYVVGMDGLRTILREAGFRVVDADSSEQVGVVVAGIDFNLTYDTLKRAAMLIRAGADFIGTNGDVTFPLPEGLAPGSGSILAALAAATDRDPLVIGKPNTPMFEAALHALGMTAEVTLMIGDRLNTDIEGAQKAGLRTALVLTGVTSRDELDGNPIQPDAVYDDLPALMAAWDAP